MSRLCGESCRHSFFLKAVCRGVADAGSVVRERLQVAGRRWQGRRFEAARVLYDPTWVDYVVADKDVDRSATQKKFADAFLRLAPGRDDKVLSILKGMRYAAVTECGIQSTSMI